MNYFKYHIIAIFALLPFWAQAQCPEVRLTVVNGDICLGNATMLARDTANLFSRDTYRLFSENNLLFTRLDSGYFPNLTVGQYRLQVTNASDCSVDTIFTIRDMRSLGVHGSQTPATCPGINNGTAQVATTHGTPPHTFRWNNGSNSAQIRDLAPGTYSVSVYEGGTCHKTASVTVGIFYNIDITPLATPAYCFNNGAVTIAAQNGTTPYQFWVTKNPLGDTTTNNTGIFRNLSSGYYSVLVQSANGCYNRSNFIIKDSTLSANIISQTAYCGENNGVIQAQAMKGRPPYRYILGRDTNTTGTFRNVGAGNHTVTIVDSAGCSLVKPITINTHSFPIAINASTLPATCRLNDGQIRVIARDSFSTAYIYQLLAISSNTVLGMNASGIFTGLSAGSYNVLVISNLGCRELRTVTVLDASVVLSYTMEVDSATCLASNGRIQLTLNNGKPPYIYRYVLNGRTYDSIANPLIINNLRGGDYVITMTDSNTCTKTIRVTVPIRTVILRDSAKIDSAICTAANGIIRLTTLNGRPPYIYRYVLNGQTYDSIANPLILNHLAAGNYTFTITDADSCTKTVPLMVPSKMPLITMSSAVTHTTCRGNDGQIRVTARDGFSTSYIYQLLAIPSNTVLAMNDSGTFTGLRAGSYNMLVISNLGCREMRTVTVLDASVVLSYTTVVDSATCLASDGRIELTLNNGRPPYTYVVNGAARAENTNPLILNNLRGGNYEITITDFNTCTETVRLNVPLKVTRLRVQTTTIDPDCYRATGEITVVAAGGTAPYQYYMDSLRLNNSIGKFPNLNVGRYRVRVVDANGCDTTFWTEVKSKGMLLATEITVPAICTSNTGSVTVTGVGGTAPYTYRLIARNESNPTGRFENLRSGNYVIRVTDSAARCSIDLPVNIGNIGRVTAAIQQNVISCIGDSVQMRFVDVSTFSNSVGALTRQWIFSNGVTDTTRIANTLFGTQIAHIQLIINSSLGCVDTARQTFKVGLLNLSLQDTVIACPNTTVAVTARANSLVMPLTYNWQPMNGNITDSVSQIRIDTIRRVIYVSVTNGICTKSDSIVSLPILRRAGDTISIQYHCENGLKLDFRNPDTTRYRLSYGDIAQPTAGSDLTNSQYQYPQSGIYRVRLIPKVPCLDTINRIVTVQSGAIVKAMPDFQQGIPFCAVGDTLILRARSIFENYIWSSQPHLNPVLSNDKELRITAGNRSQTYYVSVQQGNLRCMDSTQVVDRRLDITMQDTLYFCENLDNQLVATAANRADRIDSVFWRVSNGVRLVNGQGTLNATLRTDSSSYVYGYFRNTWGCTKQDSAKVILIRINATLTARDTLVTKGAQAHLTANATHINGLEPYSYAWNPSVIGSGKEVDCVIHDSTRITVTVTESQNGCKASSRVTVRVKHCADPEIYIPSGFSPNNDGHNDVFQVENADNYLETMYLAVFDRWGNLIFQTNDLNGSWDGKYDGMAVASGVYGYFFTGTCKGKEVITKKGNVTVLK